MLFVFSCRERQAVEPDSGFLVDKARMWYDTQAASIANPSLLSGGQASRSGRAGIVLRPEWQHAQAKRDAAGKPYLLVPINSNREYWLGHIGFRNLLMRKNDKDENEAYTVEMIASPEYQKQKKGKFEAHDFTGSIYVYDLKDGALRAAGKSLNGKAEPLVWLGGKVKESDKRKGGRGGWYCLEYTYRSEAQGAQTSNGAGAGAKSRSGTAGT